MKIARKDLGATEQVFISDYDRLTDLAGDLPCYGNPGQGLSLSAQKAIRKISTNDRQGTIIIY